MRKPVTSYRTGFVCHMSINSFSFSSFNRSSASTFTIFTEHGSAICVSYASRKCFTVIRRLMRRMSLTCTHHATAVGPIRFSNRSNNCCVGKINGRRSSLVCSHHTIFVFSSSLHPTKAENRMVSQCVA